MNKCDLCPNARLKSGQLICPHSICMLTHSELERIYKVIERYGRK